jgi:hypothetical protein
MAKPAMTKAKACESVASSLREFGYPGAAGPMIEECLDAWLTGKRDMELPHNIIGAFASRQFDEVEEAYPGVLKSLK